MMAKAARPNAPAEAPAASTLASARAKRVPSAPWLALRSMAWVSVMLRPGAKMPGKAKKRPPRMGP